MSQYVFHRYRNTLSIRFCWWCGKFRISEYSSSSPIKHEVFTNLEYFTFLCLTTFLLHTAFFRRVTPVIPSLLFAGLFCPCSSSWSKGTALLLCDLWQSTKLFSKNSAYISVYTVSSRQSYIIFIADWQPLFVPMSRKILLDFIWLQKLEPLCCSINSLICQKRTTFQFLLQKNILEIDYGDI